jgi:hypothetical protein
MAEPLIQALGHELIGSAELPPVPAVITCSGWGRVPTAEAMVVATRPEPVFQFPVSDSWMFNSVNLR